MCKVDIKNGDTRIDPCMRELISWLKEKHNIIMCCCGHGKYPMSIIVKEYTILENGKSAIAYREVFSNTILRIRTAPLGKLPKKFYKRDKKGYYYIPEVVNVRK